MKINRVRYEEIEEKIPRLHIRKNFKQQFHGSVPAPFIGRYGYPNVNIGLLSPQFTGETSYYDSPSLWSRANFKIGSIASFRYGLVNSSTQASIKDIHRPSKFLSIIQESGMAKSAVDVEVALRKPPTLNMKQQKEIIPFGPRSQINKARQTNNPKVDTRVEKKVYDTDLRSAPALADLYKKGFEENFLTKLLSVGNLGMKRSRKLVPTRWSITAVDDTLGKQLIKEIKDSPPGEFHAFFGGGWGNYYLLLFFPEVYSYELFETYLNKDINPWSKNGYAYSTDYEPYAGRKTYAEETAGGFYAARLPILEECKRQKRQHSVLALRFITSEYNVPLGVWVCREATRKALQTKPIRFASKQLMMQYATELIKKKFNFNLQLLLNQSTLLKNLKLQTKLSDF